MSEEESKTISNFELFHRVWSNAVDSSRYEKREWLELEERLMKANFLSREKMRS